MSGPRTVTHRLLALAERHPEVAAFHERDAAGAWRTRGWAEVRDEALAIAGGLVELGVAPGESVALIGDNRAEWVLCQLAIQLARAVPVPIYTTLTAEQAGYVIAHAGARVLVADGADRLALGARGARLAGQELAATVAFGPAAAEAPAGATTLAELAARGAARREETLARAAETTPEEICLLIYTSGTTGRPKGVELSHGAVAAVAEDVVRFVRPLLEGTRYRVVSYLPLSHIAEQMMSAVTPLWLEGEAFFCPKLEAMRELLPEVRPTVFLAVPRVWEKIEAAVSARLDAATGAKGRLARWAVATEGAAYAREAEGAPARRTVSRALGERLVLSKARATLGLDRLRLAISGAAPIGLATLRFFGSLGIRILEVYGMTETAAVISHVRPGRPRPGTVGPSLPCGEIRIASDGEILYRGPNLTRGYRGDAAATAELIDAEGWLHTGDLGLLEEDGSLRVTGRKKELLITAGGKNVAPAEVEPLLMEIDGVSQAVLVGDRRPYLAALLTLDPQALPALAESLGLAARTPAELADEPRLRAWLAERIEQDVNARLASYQTVKRFDVLPRELSLEEGEMTPTMKLRRAEIATKHAERIEALYRTPPPGPASARRGA